MRMSEESRLVFCPVALKNLRLCAFCLIGVCFISVCAPSSFAEREDKPAVDTLFDLSLNELLNQKVESATKSKENLRRTPSTVRIITDAQIMARGYVTLNDLLSDLPGFQFRDIKGFNSYAFMRGVPNQNNRILLLVDGVAINELNSGGFYGGAQFNLINVKKVEIVYGPASALYGTNAGGIINIITRDPSPENDGHAVSVTAGSFKTGGGAFRTGSFNEKTGVGFILSGMYYSTAKMDLGGSAGDYNWSDGMENYERDLSFDGKFSWKNLTFGFVYQDKQSSRATNYKSEGASDYDRDTLWHLTLMNLWLKHLYTFRENLTLSSLCYYREAVVNDDTVASVSKASGLDQGSQVGYYRPNYRVGVEERVNCRVNDDLRLVAGIVWEHDSLAETFSKTYSESQFIKPPSPSKPHMLDDELLSLYMQGQYSLTDEIEFTAGVRSDDSTVYGDVTTPRLGLTYQNEGFTAKLLYSEAFRAPLPWDYTYGAGNSGLAPEETVSYEGVVAYRFGENLSMDISLYLNDLDNLLLYDSADDRWENKGEVTTEGIEFNADLRYSRFVLNANYTYNDSVDEDGNRIPEIAMHDANLGVVFRLKNGLMFNLRGEYLGPRRVIIKKEL